MKLDPEMREQIRKALAGDRRAFETLVQRYARLVYAQVFTVLHQHHECEDVVQDTFVKVYASRVRLRDPDKFVPWILSIARNLARDVLRRRGARANLAEKLARKIAGATSPCPQLQLETRERHRQILAALKRLPERHRTVLRLRYLDGLGHRAIRDITGMSDGALRGVLGRALTSLRRDLTPILDPALADWSL